MQETKGLKEKNSRRQVNIKRRQPWTICVGEGQQMVCGEMKRVQTCSGKHREVVSEHNQEMSHLKSQAF